MQRNIIAPGIIICIEWALILMHLVIISAEVFTVFIYIDHAGIATIKGRIKGAFLTNCATFHLYFADSFLPFGFAFSGKRIKSSVFQFKLIILFSLFFTYKAYGVF